MRTRLPAVFLLRTLDLHPKPTGGEHAIHIALNIKVGPSKRVVLLRRCRLTAGHPARCRRRSRGLLAASGCQRQRHSALMSVQSCCLLPRCCWRPRRSEPDKAIAPPVLCCLIQTCDQSTRGQERGCIGSCCYAAQQQGTASGGLERLPEASVSFFIYPSVEILCKAFVGTRFRPLRS